MPARGSFTLADGESTPVNHVFQPDGDLEPNHGRYVNFNAAMPAASEYLFLHGKRSAARPEEYSVPGKKVPPRKVLARLLQPVTYVDSVSGLTLVDYVNEYRTESLIHPRTPSQTSKNGRTILRALTNTSNFNSVHDDGATVY